MEPQNQAHQARGYEFDIHRALRYEFDVCLRQLIDLHLNSAPVKKEAAVNVEIPPETFFSWQRQRCIRIKTNIATLVERMLCIVFVHIYCI
jgi:hypothetical protein